MARFSITPLGFILILLLLPLPQVLAESGEFTITYEHPKFYRIDAVEYKWVRINFKAEVLSGDNIDIFLVNQDNYTNYLNTSHIYYIKEGSSLNTTSLSYTLTTEGKKVFWVIFQVHIEENESQEKALNKASQVSWNINYTEYKENMTAFYLLLAGMILLFLGIIFILRGFHIKKINDEKNNKNLEWGKDEKGLTPIVSEGPTQRGRFKGERD